MVNLIRKIELSDVLLVAGLLSFGTGLYLRFDIGVSLSVCGGLVFALGYRIMPVRRRG